MIAESILELIGNTPIVKLNHLNNIKCQIAVKLENFNPGNSNKDRAALAMIEAAEQEGLLKPGSTIIEPTSGNTGIALAIIAIQKGYKCKFVCTDKVSEEKISQLKAYGAEVIICPVGVSPEDPRSYYSVAERLNKETPNSFSPNQYHNMMNPKAHNRTTGPEIWQQTQGKITHFVSGIGTGGTISGVAEYLKSQNPNIKVIAGDPINSVYSGGSGKPYLVEGIGEDFWPTTFNREIVDQIIPISDKESFLTAREITQKEGIHIGGSGGTAIAAAKKIAEDLDHQHLIVVLIPDSGRSYQSTIYNDSWMAEHGFISEQGLTLNECLPGSETDQIPYVNPESSLTDANEIMEKNNVDSLPVSVGQAPLNLAEIIGSISKKSIQEAISIDKRSPQETVINIMKEPLKTVGLFQNYDTVKKILESNNDLLVLKDGIPYKIINHETINQRSEIKL